MGTHSRIRRSWLRRSLMLALVASVSLGAGACGADADQSASIPQERQPETRPYADIDVTNPDFSTPSGIRAMFGAIGVRVAEVPPDSPAWYGLPAKGVVRVMSNMPAGPGGSPPPEGMLMVVVFADERALERAVPEVLGDGGRVYTHQSVMVGYYPGDQDLGANLAQFMTARALPAPGAPAQEPTGAAEEPTGAAEEPAEVPQHQMGDPDAPVSTTAPARPAARPADAQDTRTPQERAAGRR